MRAAADSIDVQPFLDWIDDQVAKHGSAEAVLALIGWSGDTGARRLHRWRHENQTGTGSLDDIEDALNHAGVHLWEVYDLDDDAGPEVPPVESARPDLDQAERCPCGRRKSLYARMCDTCALTNRAPNGRPVRIYTDADRVCPGCDGPKTPAAETCRSCYDAAGHGTGRRHRSKGPQKITEQQLADAYKLYLTGFSVRRVAAEIVEHTSYTNADSCARGLHAAWLRRGWKLRDRVEAVRMTHVKHGLGNGAAAKRWRRRQKGMRPRCKGVKTTYPNLGRPCQAPAMEGSEFCPAHAPERVEVNRAHLAEMRRRSPTSGRIHELADAA